MLRLFLAERDHPCPRCKYNLRRLQTQVCPECGEPLYLRVGLVHPKIALMITGLIGLSCGVGLNGLLLIYAAGLAIFARFGTMIDEFVFVNCGGLFVLGSAMALWLGLWRYIQRTPVGVRLVLAAVCWVLTLIDLVVFTVAIR
jgi:hypothetical protein